MEILQTFFISTLRFGQAGERTGEEQHSNNIVGALVSRAERKAEVLGGGALAKGLGGSAPPGNGPQNRGPQDPGAANTAAAAASAPIPGAGENNATPPAAPVKPAQTQQKTPKPTGKPDGS